MRLDLNLASRPVVNRLPQALLVGGLAALALCLTAWNVATVARSASEARAVESELAELRADEDQLRGRGAVLRDELEAVDLKPLEIRASATNEVLAQKALSWGLLLERLEDLLPWKAALRSISASVGRDGVTLQLRVRAQSQDDLLEFLDALEDSPCFMDAYPATEAKLEGGGFETTVEVAHDPYCGSAPHLPAGTKARGTVTRRGGSRG